MNPKMLFLALGLFLMASVPAAAQPSAAHVAEVVVAQKSAYAINDATNGCPFATTDILGWPASVVRECIYKEGALKGYLLLVDVKPEAIAQWIETSCSQILPNSANCFKRVLTCGRINSGMMFPVSGNVLENMDESWKNWFFRNGMTVRMPNQPNDSPQQIPLDRQKELALMANSEIVRIPSGLTRFWRTTPAIFAARFPNEGVPTTLTTAENRRRWLDITRVEFLAALTKPNNRLLEAWMVAHKNTLAAGSCP
jgi:hypothetical protein